MKEARVPSVFRGMPYAFESLEDSAVTVTLSGTDVLAREVPLDDVSGERETVVSLRG